MYIKLNDLMQFYNMMDIPTIITDREYKVVYSNDASKGHYMSEGFIPELAIEATPGADEHLAKDEPAIILRFEATSRSVAVSAVPIGCYIVFQASNAPTSDPRICNIFAAITENLEQVFTLLPTILKFASVDSLSLESLERVHRSCFSILRTVQNTQALTDLISNTGLNDEIFNVTELLSDIAQATNETCGFLPEQVPVTYIGDKDPIYITCDKEKFILSILNLISNSMLYSKDENYILIDCAATGKNVVITVADKGMGIKNELLSSVIKPFCSKHPYEDEPGAPGLGVGISLVREFVGRYKGRFSIESTELDSTTVVLRLPRSNHPDTMIAKQPQKVFTKLIKNRFSSLYIQLSPICTLKWDSKLL